MTYFAKVKLDQLYLDFLNSKYLNETCKIKNITCIEK